MTKQLRHALAFFTEFTLSAGATNVTTAVIATRFLVTLWCADGITSEWIKATWVTAEKTALVMTGKETSSPVSIPPTQPLAILDRPDPLVA